MHDLQTSNAINNGGNTPKPMVEPKVYQYTIHIPKQFNDGKPIPAITTEEFLTEALRLFGGYTFMPLPMAGAWQDGEEVYIVPMFKMDIATSDYEALKGFVEHMKAVYKQEAMCVVKTGEMSFL